MAKERYPVRIPVFVGQENSIRLKKLSKRKGFDSLSELGRLAFHRLMIEEDPEYVEVVQKHWDKKTAKERLKVEQARLARLKKEVKACQERIKEIREEAKARA